MASLKQQNGVATNLVIVLTKREKGDDALVVGRGEVGRVGGHPVVQELEEPHLCTSLVRELPLEHVPCPSGRGR